MENFNEQLVPPGTYMSSNSASLAPSNQYPQLYSNNNNVVPQHFYPNYPGNYQFPPVQPSNVLFPPGAQNFSTHFYPPQQLHFPTYTLNSSVLQVPNHFPTNTIPQPAGAVHISCQTHAENSQGGITLSVPRSNGSSTTDMQRQEEEVDAGGNEESCKPDATQASKACQDDLSSAAEGTNQQGQILTASEENKKQKIEGASTEGKSHSDNQANADKHESNSNYHHHPDVHDASAGYSRLHGVKDIDIEKAAQDAVLREQEITTQQVIHNQRQVRGTTGPSEDGKDILSGRYDSNLLKEHLLKMTTEHRTEMASKRGKSSFPEKGNIEIGNGYGVPGGSASYGASRPSINIPGKSGGEIDEPAHRLPEEGGEAESKTVSKELPEYLKRKLKARGILKDDTTKFAITENKFETQSTKAVAGTKLPPGWIEATDPSTGSVFYYNQNTSKSQWESPLEIANGSHSPSTLPPHWQEALDETTGQKYYYNTKTDVSQWNKPDTVEQNALQQGAMILSTESPAESGSKSSISRKCMGCGGWGLGLVQEWGYCNHCIRVLNLPYHQKVAPNLNYQHQIRNTSNMKEDSSQMVPNQR